MSDSKGSDEHGKKLESLRTSCSWIGCYYGILSSLIRQHGYQSCLEVGVALGFHAQEILDTTSVRYVGVDPFLAGYDESDVFVRTIANCLGQPHQESMNILRNHVQQKLKAYGDRSKLICVASIVASQSIAAESVDIIFVDGDHRFAAVIADLRTWWPKVRVGGRLCGDDYPMAEVASAVQQFSREIQVPYELLYKAGGSHPIYCFVKSSKAAAGENKISSAESKISTAESKISYDSVLIDHVKQCVSDAEKGQSKLTAGILAMEGYSSHKVRHFLNRLCSLPDTVYFEIGIFKGSTFTSALYGNGSTIKEAVAVDNWCLFGGPRVECLSNISSNVAGQQINYRVIDQDCWTIDKKKELPKPITIYFYDGEHEEEDQRKAFTYYNECFADTFIAIVDDYNWQKVQVGTRKAFAELNYTILYEVTLPARWNCDRENWWNGLFVAVIRRPPLSK